MLGTGKRNKTETRLIDTSLEEMKNSGFVDSVIAKYEVFPGSFLRVAKPYRDESGGQSAFKGIGEKKGGVAPAR